MGPVSDSQPAMPSAGDAPLANMMASHESGLLSHVQLVKSLANYSTESDMDRAVGQVLDSAQKLAENFSLLREQLNKQKLSATTDTPETHNGINKKRKMHAAPKSQHTFTQNPENESSSEPLQHNFQPGQKRCRIEDSSASAESSGHKRTRTKRAIAGERDDVSDFVPVALQRDDISEQVERRLRLREEQRKAKLDDDEQQQQQQPGSKRKRDSGSGSRPDTVATKPDRAIRKRHRAG